MISTSRSAPRRWPSISMRAIRGSSGKRASAVPTGVRRRPPGSRGAASIAPSSSSRRTPSVMAREAGGSTKGKDSTSPSPSEVISSTDGGERGAQDLRFGELGPALEVLLGVQPDRDARRGAAGAARALIRAGLGDRFDRQALHLRALGIAGDAGEPCVDHVRDPRNGQRGLGDVRGQDDPTVGARRRWGEDLLLVLGGEPSEQRQHLDRQRGATLRAAFQVGAERLGDLTDLPLPGQEDEHVPGAFCGELVDRVGDGLGEVTFDGVDVLELVVLGILVELGLQDERPVPDLDRVGAAGDLDDRGVHALARGQDVTEMLREALGIDGRGGDDDLQVRALGQDLAEVAEDHVDVQRPLVGLVDDDRVVALQQPVPADLGEQDAVRHELQPGAATSLAGEADLETDGPLPQLLAELARDALGDGARRDPSGLGVADQPVLPAVSELEQHLGDLGGLARAGGSRDHHHLMVADRLHDVLASTRDGELGGIGDARAGSLDGGRGRRRGRRGHGPTTLRGRAARVAVISAARTDAGTGPGRRLAAGPTARAEPSPGTGRAVYDRETASAHADVRSRRRADTAMMRALRKTEPGPGLSMVDLPKPQCGPWDVKMRVLRAGICGIRPAHPGLGRLGGGDVRLGAVHSRARVLRRGRRGGGGGAATCASAIGSPVKGHVVCGMCRNSSGWSQQMCIRTRTVESSATARSRSTS